jgi:pantoate--beta-alanine ligase
VLDEVPAIDVDYLVVRDPMMGPVSSEGAARMLVAGRLGGTRLLDNIAIDIGVPSGPGPNVEFDEHELPWRN